MIEKHVEILPGMIVRHDAEYGGLFYRVDALADSTAGYEKTYKVGVATVHYTQLDPGRYPVGKVWDKPEDEFREFFTIESDEITS